MSTTELKSVPLESWHQAQDAKLVSFAGYNMPVQYADGIMQEHLHTRSHASIFDVSHMGQIWLTGEESADFLERITPADVKGLAVGAMRYGLLLNEAGGVIDDLMMVRMAEDQFWVIINASRVSEDLAHMNEHIPTGVKLEQITDRVLIALQGPEAAEVLGQINPAVKALTFLKAQTIELDGVECWISRSGYSGEDGYEISIPAEAAEAFVNKLIADDRVKPAGLGARDSLRLEAGLPLYGNELNEETNPVSSGLRWAIGKARRADGDREGGFIGADAVLTAMQSGSPYKLVGIFPEGRAILRTDAPIKSGDQVVGRVTSGVYSPSLERPIAVALVKTEHADDELTAELRGKPVNIDITKMPFVPPNYYRG